MRSSIVRSDSSCSIRVDNGQQSLRPRQDIAQILNLGKQLEELRDDLVLLEAGQAVQPQVQDGLRLYL